MNVGGLCQDRLTLLSAAIAILWNMIVTLISIHHFSREYNSS